MPYDRSHPFSLRGTLSKITLQVICGCHITGCLMGASPQFAASNHSLIPSEDGGLLATGMNFYGQLGIGDKFPRIVLRPVDFTGEVSGVWAGGGTSYLLRSDGTLHSCGTNSFGQAGQGSNASDFTRFQQVGTDADWKQVSVGSTHVLGVKTDGSLWSWGYGSYGQLGQGSSSFKRTPTRIGTANDWLAVEAGYEHSLALKTTGTLWAWGNNGSGRLGDGTTTNRNVPIQCGTSNQWMAVSAGAGHGLALRMDGSLWAWGANAGGQLGDSTNETRNNPVPIAAGSTWKSLSAGFAHTLALRSDDTLWAWGGNWLGQLGLGDLTARNSPQQVMPGTTWQEVKAGYYHNIARRSDGSILWWGDNTNGKLGPASTVLTTPQAPDELARPEISILIEPHGDFVSTGTQTLYYPDTAEQVPQQFIIRVFNHGNTPLQITGFTLPAGFTTTPSGPLAIAPDEERQVTAMMDGTVTGKLTGNLAIQSNDADEPLFLIGLSGTVLSSRTDTDADGLNDAAEWYFRSMRFDWKTKQEDMVASLFGNASRAGLYTDSQLAAERPGSVILERNASTGRAKLGLEIDFSSTLGGFTPMTPGQATLTPDGKLTVPVPMNQPSGFFRFRAKAPTPSEP